MKEYQVACMESEEDLKRVLKTYAKLGWKSIGDVQRDIRGIPGGSDRINYWCQSLYREVDGKGNIVEVDI